MVVGPSDPLHSSFPPTPLNGTHQSIPLFEVKVQGAYALG